ncbi:hypothetical protein BTS2_0084 [Bacillus sp. TS-2]|nr:hypothetical protein BTS2_0084 [Bacillus sp. TS-2]
MYKGYVYMYSCHEDEKELKRLEMRALFEKEEPSSLLESSIKINPSRSPFIRGRLDIVFKEKSFADLEKIIKGYKITTSFKIIVYRREEPPFKIHFQERRRMERALGESIKGEVDLQNPEVNWLLINDEDAWYFGPWTESEPMWLLHKKKPKMYSTALSTRVARSIVNIALPQIENRTAIDPCCGIGTVLVEALSMGVNIIGSDRNPLAVIGARENIEHFGYSTDVKIQDLNTITSSFDVAILDMPYNLCSVLPEQEKINLLSRLKNVSEKAVIITVEPLERQLIDLGFDIVDRGTVRKSQFKREIFVCKTNGRRASCIITN